MMSQEKGVHVDTENLSNLHYAYMAEVRHWDPESENFTGADALFTAFDNGWTLDKDVEYEEHWYAGTRGVTVYHFTLRRDDETMTMKVVTNPLVRRMLLEMDANVTEKKSPESAKVEK